MLDPRGFVATCNSTNFFAVRDGTVLAPGPQYQMPGITRAKVLALCAAAGIPAREGDLSLAQVYSADEAFVTGGPRPRWLRPALVAARGCGACGAHVGLHGSSWAVAHGG
jgi:hypothetical protein